MGGDHSLKVVGFGVAPVVDALLAQSTGPRPEPSRYAAPERARGEPGDHRSDVFSVARIALDVLSGPSPSAPPADSDGHPIPAILVERGINAARWTAVFERARGGPGGSLRQRG